MNAQLHLPFKFNFLRDQTQGSPDVYLDPDFTGCDMFFKWHEQRETSRLHDVSLYAQIQKPTTDSDLSYNSSQTSHAEPWCNY